jgi:hypothetical protein
LERALSDDGIRQAVLLGVKALASYAEEGTIITDDNQLLSFSQIRSGLQGTRGRWMNMQNNIIIRKHAAKFGDGPRQTIDIQENPKFGDGPRQTIDIQEKHPK